MPSLTDHQSNRITKLLLIGDPGTGKTGALASLVLAGYKLRILDYDNGLDILAQEVRRKDPKLLANIEYETLTDKMRAAGGAILPEGVPTAIPRGLSLMTNWKTATADLGPMSSWGPDVVFVLDTLSKFGDAAMRYILALNGRHNKPQIQDWGEAMKLQENVLTLLYSDDIKCNVVVISHITFIGGEEGDAVPTQGYPNALGKKLPPKVGGWFNSVLLARVQGAGPLAKRIIETRPTGLVQIKHPAGPGLPATLPIETGLATFFKAVQQGTGDDASSQPSPSPALSPSGLVYPTATSA